MSIVDAAFAALRPAEWGEAPAAAADPRAEVRRRIRAGACAHPGCPHGHAPRAILCRSCRTDGWRYCPRCETVERRRMYGGWCGACAAAYREMHPRAPRPTRMTAAEQRARVLPLGNPANAARAARRRERIVAAVEARGGPPGRGAPARGFWPAVAAALEERSGEAVRKVYEQAKRKERPC